MHKSTLIFKQNLLKFCILFLVIISNACKKNDIPAPEGYSVYVGANDKSLYSFTNEGILNWKFEANGDFAYSTPVYDDRTIYSTNTDNNLYAVNSNSGILKWKFTTASTIISSPAVAGKIIYFGSDDHNFYAIDTNTGLLKWKYVTSSNIDSSPVVANGVVYFGSTDGYLYALNANSGTLEWKYYTGDVIVESSPIISNQVIFIGNRRGDLIAVNQFTGKLKWKINIDGVSLEQSKFTVNNGVIYFSSWYNVDTKAAGSLYAINESDGTLIWTGLKEKGFSSGPAYANGKLFINADDNNIYAVNALTGETLWWKPIIANGAVPTVFNENIFAGGGGSSQFYVLNSVSGDEKWKYPLPNSLTTSKPLIVNTK